MKRAVALVLGIALAAACRDERLVQPVHTPGISAVVMDGAHSGDPDFFFLPALVPDPSGDPHFVAAQFDGTLSPTVEACELTGDPRIAPAFCVNNKAPVFGPVNATLDLTDQQYRVNWDTKSPAPLDASKFYRIRVRGAAGKSALGFLDMDPVDQGMKNLKTGDVVQFQDGRTLPIKFRIQKGERCTFNADCARAVVGADGAIILTSELGAAVFIPPGSLDQGEEITVTIEKLEQTPCIAQLDLPQFPPECFRFSADPPLSQRTSHPGSFNNDVIVAMCVEVPATLSLAQLLELQLHAFDVGQGVRALPNATAVFLPCDADRFPPVIGARTGWRGVLDHLAALLRPAPAYAAMVHLGAGGSTCCFSDVSWSLPAMMLPLGVSGLTGVAGEPLTPGPTVLVTDGSSEGGGAPVLGAMVHFMVTGPEGGTPVTVMTDAKGIARFDNWVLAPGDNTLEARGLGLGTVPTIAGFLSTGVVRFTATGLVLFGVNGSDDGLSKIDPVTGVVTFINRLDPVTTVFTTPVAMAVRPSTHAIYVWNNSDLVSTGELLTVDVCTGLGTKVSPATPPQGDLQALAFAPNGALYGLDTDLWAVDPVTGVKTLIGSLGQRRVGGADFIGGKLYAFTFGDSLATVDTSTAALTLIGPLSVVVGTPGSIVFNPSTGKLLGSAFDGTSGNILFDIDPATAAVSNIRSLTGGFAPQGLGFAPPCPP